MEFYRGQWISRAHRSESAEVMEPPAEPPPVMDAPSTGDERPDVSLDAVESGGTWRVCARVCVWVGK